jgi:cytochrome P450
MFVRGTHPAIPSLPAWPLLGNLFALRSHRLELLLRISEKFGDLGAFHFGPRLVPVLNSPALISLALVSQSAAFEKTPTVRRLGQPILGEGVFLSEGELHAQQRRLLAPHFQHRRVLSSSDMITEYAYRLQASWTDGVQVNLLAEMTRLTLWIISRFLFGTDEVEERAIGPLLTGIFRHFSGAITNPLRLPQSWPTPRNRRIQRDLARLNALLDELIEARRQETTASRDLLSQLLHPAEPLEDPAPDNQELRNEALSLFVAGHETTATALTWCWYLLASHPEAAERVRAECEQIPHDRLPTGSDLARLPYTMQVWKETLRLYPPVYAFTRRALCPIACAPYLIPQGSSVVISPYALHRRPEIFPEPTRFQPERFTPSAEQQLPRNAYIPFGAGPHTCPGLHLAMLEGPLILATLSRYVTFTLSEPTPVQPEPLLTLRPAGGVPVIVTRRA